ncbi:MAG: polysaccharide ABC transporter ATP-binding protein, partial [Chloroflexota bacterium]|nr:polysaccharide ABC transporter ATP-binding protein [Chloroflexota bacterium]
DKLLSPWRRLSNPQSAIRNRQSEEDFWALRDVSFEIKQGEVVGIIGRNGAGKSTLLKILSRITEPTNGRVGIKGRVASLLEVGTGFHPELTGRENIYLNGAILGMSREEIKRKFDEIVAFAEIEKFLDTPVKRYSSGMYVRLAFAVAAHLEPEILIVDEVLAVGDAEFQKRCLGKMSEVAYGGRTIMFVSHNMTAVQALCGQAILLNQGRLVAQGQVNNLIKRYSEMMRNTESVSSSKEIELGQDLVLKKIQLQPSTIVSGDSLTFRLDLLPKRPTYIRDLTLLIYSEYGARIAVVDLRKVGLRDISLGEKLYSIAGCIPILPLVEGDYRVGLFISTENYRDNILDLASFTVVAQSNNDGFIPYAAMHRGFVELDFSLTSALAVRVATAS